MLPFRLSPEMPVEAPKYDVAISFLVQDIRLAAELNTPSLPKTLAFSSFLTAKKRSPAPMVWFRCASRSVAIPALT